MDKINNLDELKAIKDVCYVWAWESWGSYDIWQWDGDDGLGEMAPTDMAAHYRASDDKITEGMFPMYVIPKPPPKPETIDADQIHLEIGR